MKAGPAVPEPAGEAFRFECFPFPRPCSCARRRSGTRSLAGRRSLSELLRSPDGSLDSARRGLAPSTRVECAHSATTASVPSDGIVSPGHPSRPHAWHGRKSTHAPLPLLEIELSRSVSADLLVAIRLAQNEIRWTALRPEDECDGDAHALLLLEGERVKARPDRH